jgi:hypothetical protein
MKLPSNLGMLLLAIYLIVIGVLALVPAVNFNGSAVLVAILAVVAGILLLLGR